jgi:sulfur-carrier protein
MAITVKYFASLSERLGRREEFIEADAGMTVASIWAEVTGGEPLPPTILMGVNREYATSDTPVYDGDELAFLPPITGGRL